ncbi:Hypothetical predicted protein [Paramuricea clavata]|uniref:Uncharacterized protein n=1 Tax=Paramuricea clavata TaxID=317549 RepID=A0A7D9DEJ5_PARCT|nr:Hypothetical predicted protein [Paramuricea clavata]
MEASMKYIDEVFRVVRQNATNINDVPTLQKLLEAVGSFYVSLFAQDDQSEAILERRAMKGMLAKAPRIRPVPRPRQQPHASSSQDGDTPGRGMGKGRPGEPRKEDERQKRKRAEKQITPAPSKQVREATPSATPPLAQRLPNQSPPSADRPRPLAPEPRRELRLQTITASGTKHEMAIKCLGEGEKDQLTRSCSCSSRK